MSDSAVATARRFGSLEEARDFYEEHGWVSMQGVLEPSELGAVVADIREVVDAGGEFPTLDAAIKHLDATDRERLYKVHMAANKLHSLRRVNESFSEVLKSLNGSDRPVIEISIGFLLGIPRDSRLAYDFHQESSFMKGFGEISSFHFPLRDTATIANGTMSVLDRSHKLGPLPFAKSRTAADGFTDLVPVDIEAIKVGSPEIHCHLEPGDVVVFHKDCIHRSNFNGSESCRLVGVSRLTQQYNVDFRPQSYESL